jgi:hypothetical protein
VPIGPIRHGDDLTYAPRATKWSQILRRLRLRRCAL